MQTFRINTRPRQAYKIIRPTQRTMSFFHGFPRGEFAPLFRLLDDYASHQVSRNSNGTSDMFPQPTSVRTFQPRFDVKESKDVYELHGELPGIDQNAIAIEFTDPQTISIKGRTERHSESGTRPAAAAAAIQDAAQDSSTGTITPADSDASYHKATVEDDETVATGALQSAPSQDVATPAPESQQPRETARYWVSERSIGEFSRSFAFPARVDQENVRASLNNGILSIVVPKAAAPTLKRISIE